MFLTQFMARIVRRKSARSLMSLHQGRNESLEDYLMRFNQEKLATESPIEEFIYCAQFQGIRKDGPLMADLARKPPQNLHEFMDRAEEFINQEKTLRALLGSDPAQAFSSEIKKKKKKKDNQGGESATYKLSKKFQD
jgi:hypothetical protein